MTSATFVCDYLRDILTFPGRAAHNDLWKLSQIPTQLNATTSSQRSLIANIYIDASSSDAEGSVDYEQAAVRVTKSSSQRVNTSIGPTKESSIHGTRKDASILSDSPSRTVPSTRVTLSESQQPTSSPPLRKTEAAPDTSAALRTPTKPDIYSSSVSVLVFLCSR